MRINSITTLADTRFDQLRAAFREHGSHSLAYATLQSNMRYHSCPSGYLAYRLLGDGHTVAVLGDPVCALSDLEECLVGFLDLHPTALFLQISSSTAHMLEKLDLYVNLFGRECWLDINRPLHTNTSPFSLRGRKMERLRTSRNRCRREGITIGEESLSDIDHAILRDISREWLATKRVGSELQFLARPLTGQPISANHQPVAADFVIQEEDGVRLFTARSRVGEAIGFVVFDPICRYGQIEGYAASILRCRQRYYSSPESESLSRVPSGLIDTIILEAVEQFRHEGIKSINLGLMPFAPAKKDNVGELRANRVTRLLFNGLYTIGSPLFNFRSLAWHKTRYFGREEPVYFAAPQKVAQLWHLHQTNTLMGFRYRDALRNLLFGRR